MERDIWNCFSFSIWGTIWLFVFSIRSKRKYCLFLLGTLVAVSRMYLGYHWFSDVIVSIGLSYVIA
ncbi:MAG TPA: phosphatase PAP2 family protein, partial [Fusobacterium sp.]|uniref:phosphatase PAP2 family protein n=1 Tax=Fusobacterium sp. TaxID=68766 RepID=UPI002F42280F